MAKQLFANNASTAVAEFLSPASTTIRVASSGGFPNPTNGDWFLATIVGQGVVEIIKVTAVNGNVWTVQRGQEGTPARSWVLGATVECRVTAGTLDRLQLVRVDNIAELRALDPPKEKTMVYVEGYYTPGDGGGGAFLYVPASTKADNGGTVIMPDSAPSNGRWERGVDEINVRQFGARGDGVSDDSLLLRNAIIQAITDGLPVYVPTGTYITTYNTQSFNFETSTKRVFFLRGDGPLSVIKMEDGAIVANNRVLFQIRPTVDMEAIYVKDICFDGNARGSAPPATPTAYQQCHTLRFLASAGTTTKLLHYENVLIKDPAADGMNNQGTGRINAWVIADCNEIDRTRVRSSIQMSYMPDVAIITGFSGDSIESEPNADPAVPAVVYATNCVVGRLHASGVNADSPIEYRLTNVRSRRFQPEFCKWTAVNCELKLDPNGRMNHFQPGSGAMRTKFIIPYDPDTNETPGLRIYATNGKKHGLKLVDCELVLDSDDPAIRPSGYLLSVQTAADDADLENWLWELENVKFDKRAQGSVNCYRNGSWVLRNNRYACAGSPDTGVAAVYIQESTMSTQAVRVTVDGGDFTDCVGNGISLPNRAASAVSSFTFMGHHTGEAASRITKPSGGSATAVDSKIINTRILVSDTLPATAIKGDSVRVKTPSIGRPLEYMAASSNTSASFRMIRQLGVASGTSANRPSASSVDAGLMYFDTTLGKPIWWTSSSWVDASGATV